MVWPIVPTEVALRNLLHTLERLREAPDVTLTIKVPEGFSLYALYPEQYLVAAGQWLAEHQHQRAQGAVVVGIRSIGTTLAALVSIVLRAAGWGVYSLTVRPTGHPYDRQVDLGVVLPNPTAFVSPPRCSLSHLQQRPPHNRQARCGRAAQGGKANSRSSASNSLFPIRQQPTWLYRQPFSVEVGDSADA